MSFNKQNILGVHITVAEKDNILKYFNKGLLQASDSIGPRYRNRSEIFTIVTPNPEQIVMATRSKSFMDILNRADLSLPDGIGVIQASRLLGSTVREQGSSIIPRRIPGVEFMEDLVRIAKNQRVTMGLIGGRGGVAVKALECLRSRYPGSMGWAIEAPELAVSEHNELTGFSEDWMNIVTDKIISQETRVVFIGLGAPKQEYLMDLLRTRLHSAYNKRHGKPIVMMSVGGAFEILSGTIQRAPLIIRSIGLEWLWRLMKEPWRWKRQRSLITFIGLVIREKLKSVIPR